MAVIIPSGGKNIQARGYNPNEDTLVPSLASTLRASAGVFVRPHLVIGLPAVSQALRMISEDLGKLPLQVFENGASERTKAPGTWQWKLLHDFPNAETGPMAFWSDVAKSLLLYGNAFLWKSKTAGKVTELFVLDPTRVGVSREDGQKLFRVGADRELHTSARILHIRGDSTEPGSTLGTSIVTQHTELFGGYLALHRYAQTFFANDATPSGVIEVAHDMKKTQAEEMVAIYESRHRGSSNAHRTAVLTNGATYNAVSSNPAEAQLVELYQHYSKEVARIFGMPASKLSASDFAEAPHDEQSYLEHALGPVIGYVEDALRIDPDLFGPASRLEPKFHIDALLRVAPKDRAEIYTKQRQSGIRTINELRELENLPRLDMPEADIPQMVSVGGSDKVPEASKGAE